MAMIRTLPKKLTELGRIRIGDQEPSANGRSKHPHKLDAFRLTCSNKPLLHFAANLYGGEVRAWEDAPTDGQWELYTTCNALDVLIPTMSAVSVQYEMWSAGGCKLRCTGERITHCPARETLIGQPCQCPADDRDRADQAKDGKACARILRLNVLLPDLPGIGSWRLETKGYYATAEILGTLEMLNYAGAEHQIIEAVLRLEQRTVKRLLPGKDGQKAVQNTSLKFCVPVLWPKYTPRQLLQHAEHVLLTPPPTPKTRAVLTQELFGDDPRGSTPVTPPVIDVETGEIRESGEMGEIHNPRSPVLPWCDDCNQPGHYAQECPRERREPGKGVSTPPSMISGTQKSATGTPEGKKTVAPQPAWRQIIQTYMVDTDRFDKIIPPELRVQGIAAFNDPTYPDMQGLALAGEILEWVDDQEGATA